MSQGRHPNDYYSVLSVPSSASTEDIKAAFKTQAKALHPDKNQERDTTADFQKLQEAYAVLSDPEQRRIYDFGSTLTADHDPEHRPESGESPLPRRRRVSRVVGWAAATVAVFGIFYGWQQVIELSSAGISSHKSTGGAAGLSALEAEMQAAAYDYARNYSGPQPSLLAEVEVTGRNGRRYVISGVIAKQLEPTRNKLFTDATRLKERASELKGRGENLERDRRTLDPAQSMAIKHFNEKVEALNRDHAALDEAAKAHAHALEAFFAELDRVALRSH